MSTKAPGLGLNLELLKYVEKPLKQDRREAERTTANTSSLNTAAYLPDTFIMCTLRATI
jgi:hypothetical protein